MAVLVAVRRQKLPRTIEGNEIRPVHVSDRLFFDLQAYDLNSRKAALSAPARRWPIGWIGPIRSDLDAMRRRLLDRVADGPVWLQRQLAVGGEQAPPVVTETGSIWTGTT
jgi:hypothetical protein